MKEDTGLILIATLGSILIIFYQNLITILILKAKGSFDIDFFDFVILYVFIPLGAILLFIYYSSLSGDLNSQKLVKGGISEDE